MSVQTGLLRFIADDFCDSLPEGSAEAIHAAADELDNLRAVLDWMDQTGATAHSQADTGAPGVDWYRDDGEPELVFADTLLEAIELAMQITPLREED